MAADFVTAVSDSLKEFWMMFRNPSQDEKSGLRFCLIENFQQTGGANFDPWRKTRPVRPGNYILKARDMEVIFQINGAGMDHQISWRLCSLDCTIRLKSRIRLRRFQAESGPSADPHHTFVEVSESRFLTTIPLIAGKL
jgi:hypothetical protein